MSGSDARLPFQASRLSAPLRYFSGFTNPKGPAALKSIARIVLFGLRNSPLYRDNYMCVYISFGNQLLTRSTLFVLVPGTESQRLFCSVTKAEQLFYLCDIGSKYTATNSPCSGSEHLAEQLRFVQRHTLPRTN